MKKIIGAIISSVMLLITTPLIGNAEFYVESEQGSFETQTEFDYHAYSNYVVTTPSHIDADTAGEVSVTMNNVEGGYHIEAYVTNLDDNGCLTVYSENYEQNNLTAKVRVLKNASTLYGSSNIDSDGLIGKYYPSDYEFETVAMTAIGFTKDGMETIKPGIYHGTICFRFDCVKD